MHGLGRGDWGGRCPGEMEHAPEGKPTGLSPSAAPATPNQFPTSPPQIKAEQPPRVGIDPHSQLYFRHFETIKSVLDAEQSPTPRDTFQLVFAAILKLDARANHEILDGARDEHFTRHRQ